MEQNTDNQPQSNEIEKIDELVFLSNVLLAEHDWFTLEKIQERYPAYTREQILSFFKKAVSCGFFNAVCQIDSWKFIKAVKRVP